MDSLLSDSDVLTFLGVNRYKDVLWFNKEAYEDLIWWLMMISVVEISCSVTDPADKAWFSKRILPCYEVVTDLLNAAQASGYKLEKLVELVK